MYQFINTTDIKNQLANIFTDADMPAYLTESKFNHKDYLVYQFPKLNGIVNSDGITPTLRIINSHDGSAAFRIMVGCIRWVCTNGLAAGDMLYSQRIVHVAGPTLTEKLDDLPYQVAAALNYLQHDFANDMTELVNTTLTERQSIEVIGNLSVPIKVKDKSIYHLFNPRRQEDFQNNHNVWGLLNNVNESLRQVSKHTVTRFKQNDDLLENIITLARAA